MYIVNGISGKSNNQEFRIEVSDVDFVIRLHTFRNVLYCSIYANGILLSPSIKCINNKWLLPYKHLASAGNFRFENQFDGYVNTEDFNKITKLAYYTPEECAEMMVSEDQQE